MQQALVVATLLVLLGGAVLWCLRSLLGKAILPRSLVRVTRYGMLIVVLATALGEGEHDQTAVLLCCLMGGWLGQMFRERSRLERAIKGASILLSVAVVGVVIVWPALLAAESWYGH